MRPVNLLPEELRPRQRTRAGRGPAHVVLGLLGALLVLVAVYAMSLNQVNSHKTDIAHAKSEIERVKAETSASDAFGDFHAIKETRLASVKQLAGGRFDWERLMRELALVLPERTWLLGATASTSPNNAPGEGVGSSAPAKPATPAASAGASDSPSVHLNGCALDQRDVAVLLVRLRKLHRAEDVDLTESAEESTGGEGQTSEGAGAPGGSDTCGNGRFKFDVTVKFSPAAEAEAHQGGKVPARLGGGS